MSKAKVLVIEDETIISMHIESILKKLDINLVGVVKSPSKALELANEVVVDILIADIALNDKLDGIDVAKALQKKYGTQVIFITAYKDEQTLKRASDLDFSGYLLKPFNEDELIVAVKLVIDKYKLNKNDALVKINEHHTFNIEESILYLNDKELYLSTNEKKLFKRLFKNINSLVSLDELTDINQSLIKELISNLNIKLVGLKIKYLKEEKSVLLTFK